MLCKEVENAQKVFFDKVKNFNPANDISNLKEWKEYQNTLFKHYNSSCKCLQTTWGIQY